jgi:hypothetical protein
VNKISSVICELTGVEYCWNDGDKGKPKYSKCPSAAVREIAPSKPCHIQWSVKVYSSGIKRAERETDSSFDFRCCYSCRLDFSEGLLICKRGLSLSSIRKKQPDNRSNRKTQKSYLNDNLSSLIVVSSLIILRLSKHFNAHLHAHAQTSSNTWSQSGLFRWYRSDRRGRFFLIRCF